MGLATGQIKTVIDRSFPQSKSLWRAAILLGVAAIWRWDFAQHGDWMLRGYAIGMGAGTQVLTGLPWALLIGQPGEFPRAMLMGAGWVINLAVAEWIIRRRLAILPSGIQSVQMQYARGSKRQGDFLDNLSRKSL